MIIIAANIIVQALEITLKHTEEELQHYQGILKKASQTPNRKKTEDTKTKLADALKRLDETVSTHAEKFGQKQVIAALVEAGGLAAFCDAKRAAQNNSLFTRVLPLPSRRGQTKKESTVSE